MYVVLSGVHHLSYSLEESGQTALGPAALVSIVIASQKPGSKVIYIIISFILNTLY